uniref:Cyclic peptide transporter n=1 Tax=Marinomonas sp. (strain MWYL1) TaxID=400668 RepID=A6VYF9_MARMS
MSLIRYLFNQHPRRVLFVCLTSMLAGFTSMYAISIINQSLQVYGEGEGAGGKLALFTLVVAAYFSFQLFSEYMAIKLASFGSSKIRLDLAEKINKLPFHSLERIGESELLAAVTRDVSVLTSALTNTPVLLSNISIVVGGLVYLAIISTTLFSLMIGGLVIGILVFAFVHRFAQSKMQKSRQLEGNVLNSLQSIIKGAKEIRLNHYLRDIVLAENLRPSVESQRDENIKAQFSSSAAYNIYQTLVFVVIGIILFSSVDVEVDMVSASVIALLFLMGPLNGVVSMYPLYLAGSASFERISAIDTVMDVSESTSIGESFNWDEIRFKNVSYHYGDNASESFSVGPIDLSIERGKTTFIIGGNGSGKTTFSKLLVGLYPPKKGQMLLGETVITQDNVSSYRNMISAIFSDFYLFEELGSEVDKAKAEELLSLFQLKGKVEIVNGRFSDTRLSTGQRKRLALIAAIIANKEIFVMDEWAADQDPEFKEVFYDVIIPELNAQGKTLVIISHDDRYFHVADRIVKFDSGEVIVGESSRLTQNVCKDSQSGSSDSIEHA